MAKTQVQFNNAFAKKHYRRFEIAFHKTYDAELLEFFENIPNKREYVKNLIKQDYEQKNVDK